MRVAGSIIAISLVWGCAAEQPAQSTSPVPNFEPASEPAAPTLPPAVASAAPPPSSDALVASFAVGDAIVQAGVLVVLEPSLLIVTGRSMSDASTRWRTPFQPKAEGLHLLQRLGSERVLVRTAKGLTVLAAADGTTIAKHPMAMVDRTYLWERQGACGVRGQCSMQLIDCETAARIGEPLRADHSKIKRWVGIDGRGHDPMPCFGFDVDLVGRSGDVVVFLTKLVRDVGKDRGFGIDARTGRFAWRSPDYACGSCLELERGMSPNGEHCWVSDDDQLQVFDCRTGKRRFQRKVSQLEMAVWAGDESGGLFIRDDQAGTLLDPRTGRPRWRQPVRAATLAVPEDARLSDLSDVALGAQTPTALSLLDPATGRESSRIPMGPHAAVVNAPDGRVVVRDGEVERDHTGQAVPSPGGAALEVLRNRREGTGSGPPNEATVQTPRGERVDRIDADAWTLGQTEVGGHTYVAVMVAREPREVRLYRAPPSP